MHAAQAAFAMGLAVASARAHADTASSITWLANWKAAERQSRAERKPILVDFWAEWCGWCHELDRTTYRDARVVELAQGFVTVKVDAEGGFGEMELVNRYGVRSLPTIAFLTPAGRVLFRRTAFEGPEPFRATLEAALRLSAEARPFEETLARDGKDPAALGGLGAVLAEQGPSEDSRDLLGRARKLDDKRPAGERKRTRRLLAAAEVARGRRSEALALLTEAIALKPADPAEDEAAAEAGRALSDR